jgi:hypothetical protein
MGILIDHDIKKILGFLRKNNYLVKKMADVEMLLFRFLYDPTSEDGVPEIQEMLRTTPEYFVDFLKSIYRSDEDIKNKIRKELSKEESDYANFIYRIFDHWKTVPGLIEEKKTKDAFEGDIPFSIGSVDENALFKWAEESKKLAEEADRVSGFEISLGRILAYSPADNENTWPCLGVRNLLEKYYSEKIAEQIRSEVYNRRGCYTVTTNDGRQDRQLVEKFNKYYENIKTHWPESAKVVKRIADNFEEDAKRRDEKAKYEEFE